MIDTLYILIFTATYYLATWVYACFEGIREGYYFHSAVKSGDVVEYNLHGLFLTQRIFVLMTMALFVGIVSYSFFFTLSFVFYSIASFSFWHNGSYYATRNNLDPSKYKLRFRDNSTSSKAIMEFNFKERLIQFVLSFLLFLTSIIIYNYTH